MLWSAEASNTYWILSSGGCACASDINAFRFDCAFETTSRLWLRFDYAFPSFDIIVLLRPLLCTTYANLVYIYIYIQRIHLQLIGRRRTANERNAIQTNWNRDELQTSRLGRRAARIKLSTVMPRKCCGKVRKALWEHLCMRTVSLEHDWSRERRFNPPPPGLEPASLRWELTENAYPNNTPPLFPPTCCANCTNNKLHELEICELQRKQIVNECCIHIYICGRPKQSCLILLKKRCRLRRAPNWVAEPAGRRRPPAVRRRGRPAWAPWGPMGPWKFMVWHVVGRIT